MDNSEEMFPVVDEDGNILSAATRGECHSGSKRIYRNVRNGKIYSLGNGILPLAVISTWEKVWKWP